MWQHNVSVTTSVIGDIVSMAACYFYSPIRLFAVTNQKTVMGSVKGPGHTFVFLHPIVSLLTLPFHVEDIDKDDAFKRLEHFNGEHPWIQGYRLECRAWWHQEVQITRARVVSHSETHHYRRVWLNSSSMWNRGKNAQTWSGEGKVISTGLFAYVP